MLACQHKPTSRELQRAVAPESTPRAASLDGGPPFEPPFFVKPVVGRLSQGAVRIDRLEDLAALSTTQARVRRPLRGDRRARGRGARPTARRSRRGASRGSRGDARGLRPRGPRDDDRRDRLGHVPGTISFERFEYPSALPDERRAELAEIASALVPAHGLDDTFFNIELFVPTSGPGRDHRAERRLASQFAPLVLALHGRSTYDALFALACGDDPGLEPRQAGRRRR